MATALSIKNWDARLTRDAKKTKVMQWVPMPIDHEGCGFMDLMSYPDGIRIMGGWLLINQVAARCPRRGILVSENGKILTAKEIAWKVRAPVDDIRHCIDKLLHIGWLENVEVSAVHPDDIRTPSVQHPDDIRTTPGLEERRREERRGDAQERDDPSSPPTASPQTPVLGSLDIRDEWQFFSRCAEAKQLRGAFCVVRQDTFLEWKALCDTYGIDQVVEYANAIPLAKERFPSRVHALLTGTDEDDDPSDDGPQPILTPEEVEARRDQYVARWQAMLKPPKFSIPS